MHQTQSRGVVAKDLHDAYIIQGLQRLLDARQLTLKYIANVTYGYTAATFSGRMPAVEIADSIVQTGRETLEKVNIGSCKDNVATRCTDSFCYHYSL